MVELPAKKPAVRNAKPARVTGMTGAASLRSLGSLRERFAYGGNCALGPLPAELRQRPRVCSEAHKLAAYHAAAHSDGAIPGRSSANRV